MTQVISQPYVQEYVDVPAVAENRLALLYFFLRETGFTKERAKVYCVTTGLVQLGLDTHEMVKIQYDESLVAERNRQLSVLAGDYYSSYYYHLLAEAGEIEAIAVLAQAIQEVNEAKMKLYLAKTSNQLSLENYLSLRKTIDTALYLSVVQAHVKNGEESRFWTNLIEQTTAFEQMIAEWEQLRWQQQVPFGFSQFLLQKPGSTLANVIDSIEAKVMELLSVCEQLIINLNPTEKQTGLAWVTSRYSHRVKRLKRAEEM
ncbi:heptaprenyl diphosphate synthase component 1 [Brevibacillus dissolubilis]|uniref:heptaprenyl diphosphate synthase component 1 n=1 Tax=Brevibacillus dissolubilis TaxID=1844116 RepID=UPI001116B379|nr:heptaprenyl diphosphate synthase component 1 [Brevibacillus dissolubilis]